MGSANIFEEGQVLLINKPLGWTSFDIVKKIRSLIRVRKVGHAGTLDPLATGLLIVCTGKFTKRINEFMAQEKEYTGSFTLGATTPSYDLETEPFNEMLYDHLNEDAIRKTSSQFVGDILQVPPIHSAIKVGGKPVYKLARKGVDVQLQARKINIKEFEITNINLPDVHFRVVCSTGTYIRSLAHDFGQALQTGAYLSSLARTRIGNLHLKDSMTISEAEAWINSKKTEGE
jgi:tRNA pseudouridine55 synthase